MINEGTGALFSEGWDVLCNLPNLLVVFPNLTGHALSIPLFHSSILSLHADEMITIRQNICFRNPIIPNRKNPSCCSLHHPNTRKLHKNILCCSSSSSPEEETNNGSVNNEEKQKLGVVVKAMKRPNVVLKLMWMEKNIGIAIEQVIPGGKGTIPLSPYYFWPRKDACEELKVLLEGKPWISHKQVALLLDQAANIINLWQQRNGTCY